MKVLPLMMSHLFGRAVLDQGPDHQPFLGLVFSQTEAKTCMILREERKSQQNAPHKSRNKKNPCRISAKTWGRMTCWMSVECAESGCDRSHSVLDPWAFWPRAALFLMEVKKKKKKDCHNLRNHQCRRCDLFFWTRMWRLDVLPDENDLDFGRRVIDDGGGVLVTPAVQDLPVDLKEKSRHVQSTHRFLSLSPASPWCHPSLQSSANRRHPLRTKPSTCPAPLFIIVATRSISGHPSNGNLSSKSTRHSLPAHS